MPRNISLLAVICLIAATSVHADPVPLPADPEILALVSRVSADSLLTSVESLVDFHTRHTYSDTLSDTVGVGAARRWLSNRYGDLGISNSLFPWTGYWGGGPYPCYNVHATLEGSGGLDNLIILGGHVDSRTVSANDITGFAPGADDDGSAVAAMLEMGRLLRSEDFTTEMILASFTGEEQGLLGSEAFAGQLFNVQTPITGMINMDMIGHIVHPGGAIDSSTVRCFSGGPQESPSRQLARYLKWAGESYSGGLTVLLQNALDRPGRGGDHIPFYNLGYPAVRLIETAEDVAYQHGPNDVPQNMSFSYARKVTRLSLGVAALLAKAPLAPASPEVLNAGDGQTLLVSWPDSVVAPPGGCIRVAYRSNDQLYWQDVLTTTALPPLQISGLQTEQTYEISLSLSDSLSRPSPFSLETSGIPEIAPPPDDFETTSTPTGVLLQWQPRPEPNALEYLIERALPSGNFTQIAAVPHPDSSWTDESLNLHQLCLYRLRTRNQQMAIGEPTDTLEGQLASHDLGILAVDATLDGSGFPGPPTDSEVDDFYQSVLASYVVGAFWDRADSQAAAVTISDADLAPYEIVLVYADFFLSSFATDTTALRKYLENGGKTLVSGWRLSYSLAGRSGFQHSFAAGDFLYDLAGIDSINVTPASGSQFIGLDGALGYPDLTFDAARIPYWGGSMIYADAIWTDAFAPGVSVIGNFQAASGSLSPYHGKAIALRGGAPEADWIILDAPGYLMTVASATPFLRQALEDLGAQSVAVQPNPHLPLPLRFHVERPRPNPFNPTMAISFELRAASYVNLRVYDTAGRMVAQLVNGWRAAGTHEMTFDGSNLPSGIYLVRLRAGDFAAVQKVILLK